MRDRRTLRVPDALDETLANLRARWALSMFVFIAVLVLAFASMTMVVSETSSIASDQQDLFEKGATGFIVSAGDAAAGLSAVRCEELNHIDGVVSAGARGALIPSDAGFPGRLVTSGYVRSVHPDVEAPAGTVAGASIASTWHLVQGSGIRLSGDVLVPLDAVAGRSARDPRVDGEVLAVAPASSMQATECVVISSSSSRAGVEALATNWFAPRVTTVSPLAPNLGAAADVSDRFMGRASIAVPLVAGGLTVLMLVGAWFSRRSDFALYRLLGAKRGSLTAGLLVECVLLISIPSLAGIGLAVAARPESVSGPVLEAVTLAALQFLAMGCAALPLGVLLLLTKNPSGLIREGA